MPGHFLVRPVTDPTRDLDVFDGGAELDAAGCREIFAALNPAAPWHDEYLQPVDERLVLVRILANLAGAHRRSGDRAGLCWALTLRSELPEMSERERRELAVVPGARSAEHTSEIQSL